VLQPSDARVRAVIFTRLVAIAHQLVLMAAYGPASALIGGLLSPAVMRLKKTNELVDSETQTMMKELEKLIAPEKNHKHYREVLQVTLIEKRPCCPYLGLYLADLTFTEVIFIYLFIYYYFFFKLLQIRMEIQTLAER
jgi:hypothetical protein